ncbi:hypothetical protein KDK82_2596 [Delftia sp. K82]|nr:hypothetical protein KDK82_2596 [Delftia sp. K82]
MSRAYYSSVVTILSRTKMGDDRICVGAWDENNEEMVRLLNEKGGALVSSAPYTIGEKYSVRLAAKDAVSNPHLEDVVVYAAELLPEEADMEQLTDDLADQVSKLSDLFDGHLERGGKSLYVNIPTNLKNSVQIAKLGSSLIKEDDYYRDGNGVRVKFVGFESPGYIIPSGKKIRFSLSRPWDRDDNGLKCYLQLSGVY